MRHWFFSSAAKALRRSTLVLAVGGLGAVGPAGAAEPGPHVHGTADLRVAIDGDRLAIDLDSPLDNLLGFEHPPRTDGERAAVRAMAAKLRRAVEMFGPTPAARCLPSSVQLASAVLPPDLLGERAAAPTARAEEAGHADLDASFAFACAVPAKLDGLNVALLQAFPGLRTLNVAVAGPKGQSAAVLTSAMRRVGW